MRLRIRRSNRLNKQGQQRVVSYIRRPDPGASLSALDDPAANFYPDPNDLFEGHVDGHYVAELRIAA